MDLELAGRRAVVTGGGSGIGLARARALAAEALDLCGASLETSHVLAGGVLSYGRSTWTT